VRNRLKNRGRDPESLANDGQGTGANCGIRCDEPQLAAAWIQICRLDNLLLVDASDGDGERSSRDLSTNMSNLAATIAGKRL